MMSEETKREIIEAVKDERKRSVLTALIEMYRLGNEQIRLPWLIPSEIEPCVEIVRDFGLKRFTIDNFYYYTSESLREFEDCGCRYIKDVEIKGTPYYDRDANVFRDTYEKALLFELD